MWILIIKATKKNYQKNIVKFQIMNKNYGLIENKILNRVSIGLLIAVMTVTLPLFHHS